VIPRGARRSGAASISRRAVLTYGAGAAVVAAAAVEGRIHFAGEHSSEHANGWMQGALESSTRVAREISLGASDGRQ
jgi:hypothetical protein